MLDDRKKKVLQAIVEEYINTAEPVSSNALTKNHGLDCSSATIRNEMADLEKSGYLDKTHTSSRRIPSEKGYRYYVDEWLKDDNISMEEIKYISDKLETKVNEIEDLTKIATTTISEITHYTTLAIGPSSQDLLIEEIKFVLLGPRMLMAIILTNTGMVKETIIKFDEDITDKQVETINYMFNQKLKGQPLQIIDVPLEEYLINEMKYSVKVIKPIIEQIKKVLTEDRQLYLEGTNKLKPIAVRPENKYLWAVWKIEENYITGKLDLTIITIFRGKRIEHTRNQERILIANNGYVKQILPK